MTWMVAIFASRSWFHSKTSLNHRDGFCSSCVLCFTFIWLITSCFACPCLILSCLMPPHSEAFVIFIHFAGSFIHASCTCGITESFVARLFVVPPHFFLIQDGTLNSTTLHHGTDFGLSTTFHMVCFSNHWDSWHQKGIRQAFLQQKTCRFLHRALWLTLSVSVVYFPASWNLLQMKLAKMKKTDVGFSLCGLSCRDLMQILIVCNIIDVCCPVFLGHHHNYTFWSDTALVLMQLDFFQTITAEEDTRFDVLPLSSSRASATFFIGSLHNWSDQEEGRDSRSGSSRVLAWYLVPKVRWQWQKTFSGIARIMTNK